MPVLAQRVLDRVLPWTEYFCGQSYLTSYSPQCHKEQLSSVKQLSIHKVYRKMNYSTDGQTRNDITTLIFVCVCVCVCWSRASLVVAQMVKILCNAGDLGSIPGSGSSPREGNGYPLQYSCLENSMDRGTWWATFHEVAKSRTELNN